MAGKEQKAFEVAFKAKFEGKFPPQASELAKLGFDSVSITKSEIRIKKERRGLDGKPLSYTIISIKKDCVSLTIFPKDSEDVGLFGIRAYSLLLRVLSIFPSMWISSAQLSLLLLPALSSADEVASTPYALLAKKYREAKANEEFLSAKNKALLKSSEESLLARIELEKKAEALSSRVAFLEQVSDHTLCELIKEWILLHKGSFNAVLFSKAHSIPPARAEEGLQRLIAAGEIIHIGRSFKVSKADSRGVFDLKEKQGLLNLSETVRFVKDRLFPKEPRQKDRY